VCSPTAARSAICRRRSAIDRDEFLPGDALFSDILLHAGNTETAGWFNNGPCVLEDVTDRSAYLVGIHRDELVNELLAKPESLVTDTAHGDAVGKNADVIEYDRLTGCDRVTHCRRIVGLDTDDAHIGLHRLDAGSDARNESATTDRDENGIDLATRLLENLETYRALARDNDRIVKRMHEKVAVLFFELARMRIGVIIGVAMQDNVAPKRAYGVDLDRRCRHRHDDGGFDVTPFCGKRDSLRMVARRTADYAVGEVRLR
jgi:hypothetical protein